MSVNSSSSNLSFTNPLDSSSKCSIFSGPSSLIYTALNIIKILVLLPLCLLVLFLGLRRWRRQRSTSTPVTMSHSDSVAYHAVSMELFGVAGYIVLCYSIYMNDIRIFKTGMYFWFLAWYGQMLFHTLTCVEHYLAVVHPVTYVSLRGERGVRIRNISIGCIWPVCIGGTSLTFSGKASEIFDLCVVICCLTAISFCSVSVLCTLIRPGPGEQGRERDKVDQSKQRAFYIITAAMGALLLRCLLTLIWTVLKMLGGEIDCVMMMFEVWVNLPSSLVLPLLFLHRAGTLACCKKTPNEDKD